MTYSERLTAATADFIFLRDRFIGNYSQNLKQIAIQYDVDEIDLVESITNK